MVISPYIILFLAIALMTLGTTSYSIDDKPIGRASIAGTEHINQNLWQEFKYGISYKSLTSALNTYLPTGKLSAVETRCVDLKPRWHCLRKQAQGKCQRHPKWAERKCKKSCNLCVNTKTDVKSKYLNISELIVFITYIFYYDNYT